MTRGVYAKIVSLVANLDREAPIMRQTHVLNLKARNHFDPGYDLLGNVSGKVSVFVEPIYPEDFMRVICLFVDTYIYIGR